MTGEMISLRIDSPVRPPDWRIQRARRLADLVHSGSSFDLTTERDELIRHLLQCEKSGWTGTAEIESVIRTAIEFQRSATDDERRIIQCRLLAGESDEVIAHRVHQDPETIQCYEQLFYHCRDRLRCEGFIRNQFLPTPDKRPTVNAILHREAYYHGPIALEVLESRLAAMASGSQTPKPKTLHEYDQAIEEARFREWLAGQLIHVPDLLEKDRRAFSLLTSRDQIHRETSHPKLELPRLELPLYPISQPIQQITHSRRSRTHTSVTPLAVPNRFRPGSRIRHRSRLPGTSYVRGTFRRAGLRCSLSLQAQHF